MRAQPVRILVRGDGRTGTAIAGSLADLEEHQVTHSGSFKQSQDEVGAIAIGWTCFGVGNLDDLPHMLTDSDALRTTFHPTESE